MVWFVTQRQGQENFKQSTVVVITLDHFKEYTKQIFRLWLTR